MSSIWDGLPAHTKLQKFGRIPDIDAAETNEDVWDGEGAYSFLGTATALTISSASTDDTAAGTGARTIRVFYLDANYNEQTADITMNGQSAAATTITALRVYRAYVLTAGSGGVNAGNIWIGSGTITTGVPANKYAAILAGNGQTLMAIYTIPEQVASGANVASGILRRWYATIGAGQSARASVALQTRSNGGAWRTRRVCGVGEGGWMEDETWIELDTKTDIRVRVLLNGVNNSTIEAGFDVALLK